MECSGLCKISVDVNLMIKLDERLETVERYVLE